MTQQKRKTLTLAVAAALMAPITSHADIKIYGQLGAEAASVEVANGDENLVQGNMSNNLGFTQTSDDMSRQTMTLDRYGNILNDGPNLLGLDFDFDKKVAGLTPYARYRTTFHTTDNTGLGPGLEAWVGFRSSFFHMKYGKLRGAYRNAKGLIDPWIYTSMQARGTGGGMSAGRYNEVHWNWNAAGKREVVADPISGKVGINPARAINTSGVVHNSDIPGAVELGLRLGPVVQARVQIMGDDGAGKHGGNAELKLTTSLLDLWAHGAYLDVGTHQLSPGGTDWNNDEFRNWKVGARLKFSSGIKLALQYEDAELGVFDNNPDGGKYIIGSIDYRIENVTIAGWTAGYLSNIDEKHKLIDTNGQVLEEDALSWSLGAKYHFSKRNHIFAGYRQTDSDNDYRDENVFSAGILHKF